METAFKVIIGIIALFAVGGFLFGKEGEKEEAAKAGAALGGGLILSVLPTVLVIAFIILLVRACS